MARVIWYSRLASCLGSRKGMVSMFWRLLMERPKK